MSNKQSKGFTLIEIAVAVAVFMLVISAGSGLFVSAMRAQRKSLASQEILDQVSYALEYMSRALRMAQKELNCSNPVNPAACACLQDKGYGYNYEIIRDGEDIKGIKFVNYQGFCQEFFRQWDGVAEVYRLKEKKDGDGSFLTSSNLNVELFNIALQGEAQTLGAGSALDNEQSRATLFLKIKSAGSKAETQPDIEVQTTVSQRNLDIRH